MQQDERHRVGTDAFDMQIMKVDAFERDAELRKGVQGSFFGPPVKFGAPVFREFAKITDIGAIGPCITGRLIGKARSSKAVAEVGDVGVRDMKRE